MLLLFCMPFICCRQKPQIKREGKKKREIGRKHQFCPCPLWNKGGKRWNWLFFGNLRGLVHLENCQYKDSISHKCPNPYVIVRAFEGAATLDCQVKERYCIRVGHKVFSSLNDSLMLLSCCLEFVSCLNNFSNYKLGLLTVIHTPVGTFTGARLIQAWLLQREASLACLTGKDRGLGLQTRHHPAPSRGIYS